MIFFLFFYFHKYFTLFFVTGRIRVNEGHIITYNVPATNGVLHAIDAVL